MTLLTHTLISDSEAKGATTMTSSQGDPDQQPQAQYRSVRKKRQDAGQMHWQERDYDILACVDGQCDPIRSDSETPPPEITQ
jgi:hypothetical protein